MFLLFKSKAKLQFERIRQMIDGKPYQQHVVQQFHAVDESCNDAQVSRTFCNDDVYRWQLYSNYVKLSDVIIACMYLTLCDF